MSKLRTYLISFAPVTRKQGGGYEVSADRARTSATQEVHATTLPDLEHVLRQMAAAFGPPCSPWIRMPEGERPPARFDAWRRTVHIITEES